MVVKTDLMETKMYCNHCILPVTGCQKTEETSGKGALIRGGTGKGHLSPESQYAKAILHCSYVLN